MCFFLWSFRGRRICNQTPTTSWRSFCVCSWAKSPETGWNKRSFTEICFSGACITLAITSIPSHCRFGEKSTRLQITTQEATVRYNTQHSNLFTKLGNQILTLWTYCLYGWSIEVFVNILITKSDEFWSSCYKWRLNWFMSESNIFDLLSQDSLEVFSIYIYVDS